MADSISFKTLKEMKEIIKEPLYANRYVASITTNNKDSSAKDDIEKLNFTLKSISLPTMTYNAKQLYINGINTPVTNMFEQGNLDITVYNVNNNWKSFYDWGQEHYNQEKRTYGYISTYSRTLRVYQFKINGDLAFTHTFKNVTLYTLGSLQYQYEEANEIQTFQVALQYRYYEFESSGSKLSKKPDGFITNKTITNTIPVKIDDTYKASINKN